MTNGAEGEGIVGVLLKWSCMFSMSNDLMCCSKKGVPRMLHLIFATAKGIIKVRELLSIVV